MNILEILNKNTCLGQKLYTPAIGVCYLRKITECDNIIVSISDDPCNKSAITLCFDSNGRLFREGEILLFPSKEMKYWDKFAWKEGDILTNPIKDDFLRFWKWANDDYTEFNIMTIEGEKSLAIKLSTEEYQKATEMDLIRFGIINKLQLRPGQRVLVRDNDEDDWNLHFFSHYRNGKLTLPVCIGGDAFVYTIPYKGNQDLLGTTRSK